MVEEAQVKCLVQGHKVNVWESQEVSPAACDPGAMTGTVLWGRPQGEK